MDFFFKCICALLSKFHKCFNGTGDNEANGEDTSEVNGDSEWPAPFDLRPADGYPSLATPKTSKT